MTRNAAFAEAAETVTLRFSRGADLVSSPVNRSGAGVWGSRRRTCDRDPIGSAAPRSPFDREQQTGAHSGIEPKRA